MHLGAISKIRYKEESAESMSLQLIGPEETNQLQAHWPNTLHHRFIFLKFIDFNNFKTGTISDFF